ncbi:STAS domain-containing protein [Streptomyces lavendofoliae]|uniref:STAS domain-containing protein n=1 Tax=Streptomyces lavendofoliae TaxID=67314 RepID=UPI003D8D23CF
MPDFTVTAAHHADGTIISVTGEMDIHTYPQVEEATTVLPIGDKTLYLDLSGMPFMDSMGLNLLLRLRNRMQATGGRLILVHLQGQPSGVLHLTEAYTLFDIIAPADTFARSA